MRTIDKIIDLPRNAIKKYMNSIAKMLNNVSGGKITPNMVTIYGFLMHIPIAILIAFGEYKVSALLLIFFGLFDALDGAMARLQNKANNAGMLLDASTDRMKEVLLYTGVSYVIISGNNPIMAVWAVSACGASICVSYVKAKGETAVKDANLSSNEINRLFSDGIFRFEIRMLLLVVGLLTNQLILAMIIITIGSTYTALERLVKISRKLN